MFYGWRRWLRVRWYRADKALLILFAVFFCVLTGCSYFAYARHTQDVKRHGHEVKRQEQQLNCLALNVYYEARGESRAGQFAVAEVTMNRLASRHYPKTVCDVVYQKNWDWLRQRYVGAFSWTEFDSLPPPHGAAWQRAQSIAEAVYYRRVPQPPELKGALHYHSIYVRPNWSDEKKVVELIGNHFFYN
jgi:spore germination cell wall hydrolase CwlJ-like protein